MSTMFADTLLIVFISVCTALLAEGEWRTAAAALPAEACSCWPGCPVRGKAWGGSGAVGRRLAGGCLSLVPCLPGALRGSGLKGPWSRSPAGGGDGRAAVGRRGREAKFSYSWPAEAWFLENSWYGHSGGLQ